MRDLNTNWIKARSDLPRKQLGLTEFGKGSFGRWELLGQGSSTGFQRTSSLARKAGCRLLYICKYLSFKEPGKEKSLP